MPATARSPHPAAPPAAPAPASRALTAPQKALRKLGLLRDIDLALHLPLRYEDQTRLQQLADAGDGDWVQVEGVVTASEPVLHGRRQWRVALDDGSQTCLLRFFNLHPGQQAALAVGRRLRVRGQIQAGFAGLQMMHPVFQAAGGALPQALTPIYPTSAGLPQAYLRRAVETALERVELADTVPQDFLDEIGLQARWNLRSSLSFLHHPTPRTPLAELEDRSHPAWRRLKAEELLAQQLSQQQARLERAALRAPALPPAALADSLRARLLAALPFALTPAQQHVVAEIARDLARPEPMHRLLQGDVGAGKTVVAALAAAVCIDAGWQCALMAPTEILAGQHVAKLVGWLQPLGVRIAWLSGSQKPAERRAMLAAVASGEAQLVVGTHAVIQDKVRFARLALAVIDEQHRFGVAQRLALRAKLAARSLEPHLLMMTATPIPRTLAMSHYADLDVSTLDELPPGRTPVVTRLVHESRRDEVIGRIRSQLAQGRQVYWVCPLIEESEALDLRNATQTHEQLGAALPGVQVGLLHSRMPAPDKQAVMAAFSAGQMAVLVSTTVIEVGVDVPNASLMVIEHAERFGLSQLHQLRGRVGRGAAASACVLLYATGDAPRLGELARERLRAMAASNDGFEIARRDLELRGPGEFLGERQSGAALLRFADLQTDTDLLEWARSAALRMLQQQPELARRHLARWLGGKSEFLKA
ncbi:MAG: ATP-dependent DNA helicase RecG [Rhodoferax sp.]|nr:ATP-dependent DNA helicase RecG [Rhodoferax sp.]